MTGLNIDIGVCHIISRILLVNISADSGGSGVKGHSKVKFRFEHNSCAIHMTGLKLGIGVCHVNPRNFNVCPKRPMTIQGSKVI